MKQRKGKTVLFLCTGNYYRSRFAEVLFNSVARKMGLPWEVVARLLGGGQRPQGQPTEDARASPSWKEPAKKPVTVRVGRETAGRRGKGVTTVFDVPLDENGLRELAAALKQRCGTGGTVKDGRIEIQGDQRERIVAELEKLGYKVKRVGG
jgi:translation initiation factor 1